MLLVQSAVCEDKSKKKKFYFEKIPRYGICEKFNWENLITLPCHNINSTLNVVVQVTYNAVTNRDQACILFLFLFLFGATRELYHGNYLIPIFALL
jgi:hypothetical protein